VLYLFDTSALLAHYRREDGWQQVQAIFDDATAEIRSCRKKDESAADAG
jgi:hypothetical protein